MRKKIMASFFFVVVGFVFIIFFINPAQVNLKEFKFLMILGLLLTDFSFIAFVFKEKLLTERNKTVLLLTWMTLLLSFNFNSNFFCPNNIEFSNFQEGSEKLVMDKVKARTCGIKNTGTYGLGYYDREQNIMTEYISQYGLQGKVFQMLYKINIKHLLCIMISAFIFSLICLLIMKKYGKLFAFVFFMTFLLSPWIVNFARNLYWVEFTWFIPMLIGLVYCVYSEKRIIHLCCYVGAFLSIFIKSLCGYEYLPVIMLGMISFPLVDFLVSVKENKCCILKQVKPIILIGICAISGFFVAIILHARIRGNGSILEGLNSIYTEDVLRRTLYGKPENFLPVYTKSLQASIADVIRIYYNNWHTEIITGISGRYFSFLTLIPIIIFMYSIIKGKLEMQKIFLYFVFLVTCTSWFILGKAHSYIHTHMNYVLWYFGYVQVCFYIIIDEIINHFRTFLFPKLRETFSK